MPPYFGHQPKPRTRRFKKKSSLKKKAAASGEQPDSIASQLLSSTKKNAQPPTKVGTTDIKKETVDLKSFKRPDTEEEKKNQNSTVETTDNGESKAFTEEALKTVWTNNLETRKKAEAPESELAILRRNIRLDGMTIIVPITNQLEETFAARFEQELTLHLRKELQNAKINIKFNLEVEEEKQKLYTGKDKFEALAEQNPLLRELKDRLGLDYDF